ncbi:ubiquitin-like protein DskB [Aspergillus costaricaensis CBS 115574]|uniref:Ubiquitin-like protein DskB n=1 Tax=Aspergillus costaricaensis CBS 115574 TaxID=1448317 RepID=A0ACD1IBK5_9EURO|nr:ubiquitin-like protein DskB [Aspergillus costaricaensis CBS 115574]RAK87713.1 ubiquitin-like protein DskB [Aspergillus costaricaensis CBS 115574]
MADDTAAAEDAQITFNVKSSNDAKYTLTLPSSTSVSDLKEKLSSSEYADTPAERQRLIYSGRVLKDNETLATYKIKDGHTIHLVKSAPSNVRPGGAASTTSTSAPAGAAPAPAAAGVPTNLAAGTGNNPLAGLTGARYAGFAQLPGAGMFGPDGGMGPPPDTESMLNMLENPQFQSTINEALQNPAMIDMMIQQNPMLREMGPGVRQMMQSPEFRRMLTDPNSIRQMVQMQRAMGGGGLGGGGAFPAPGVTNTTPEANRDAQNNTGTTPTPGAAFNPFMPAGLGAGNPFAALFGGNPMMGTPAAGATPSGASPTAGGTQQEGTERAAGGDNATGQGQNQQGFQNPFNMFMNPALFGGQGGQAGANPFNPQQNPFLRDPALLQQWMQNLGAAPGEGGAAGTNPLAALFGGGFGSPPPQDNRPPEERYAEQLRQLNDMGFFEFERNIEALRRAGGSVQGAVEYLLSHPS